MSNDSEIPEITSLSLSPFRFLDLPNEVRDLVYDFYYGSLAFELRVVAGGLRITKRPELYLEGTCRDVRLAAKHLRERLPVSIDILLGRGSLSEGVSATTWLTSFREISIGTLTSETMIRSQTKRARFEFKNQLGYLSAWEHLLLCFPELLEVQVVLNRGSGSAPDFSYDGAGEDIERVFSNQALRDMNDLCITKYRLETLASLLRQRHGNVTEVSFINITKLRNSHGTEIVPACGALVSSCPIRYPSMIGC